MVTRELIKAAAGAVRPWQSLDAGIIEDGRRRRYAAVFTAQSEIDRCLKCARPTCNGDCRRKKKGAGHPPAPQNTRGFNLMDKINFETATGAELAAFLQEHPGHVTLLNATRGVDAETVACLACMAEAYTHGATDAEALDTFNKALAFYGRKPVTTMPKVTS